MSSTAWYGSRLIRTVSAVAVVALLALGSRLLLGRDVRALVDLPPAAQDVLAALERQEALSQPGIEPADRDRVLESASADQPAPAAAVPEKPPPAFLPPELQVLAKRVPAKLETFEAASPKERLQLGSELLSFSIAVIQCVKGTGPIPRGAPGDGDLSFAGQGGKWSFQLNFRTFHFDEREFPEYAEYLALLNSVYDEQGHLLSPDAELPEQLTQDIRLRACEALGWL
jgi:hypothetical protein